MESDEKSRGYVASGRPSKLSLLAFCLGYSLSGKDKRDAMVIWSKVLSLVPSISASPGVGMQGSQVSVRRSVTKARF